MDAPIPADCQTLLSELNPGDVGHEVLSDGSVLRFEGFTDMCWEAHVNRFGNDGAAAGVAVVETEMHAQWLKAHPGMCISASGWIGGSQPWDECLHWVWLTNEDEKMITIDTVENTGINQDVAEFISANATEIAARPQIAEGVIFNLQLALGAYDHALDDADINANADRPQSEIDAIVAAEEALNAAMTKAAA